MNKYIKHIVILVILASVAFIVYKHIQHIQNEYKLLKQQYVASTDSLRTIDTKYGKLSMKYSNVLDKNDSIVNMFSSYKDDIVMLDAVDIVYTDSFGLDNDIDISDSLVNVNFSYEDSIRSMLGVTSFIIEGCDSFRISELNSIVLYDSIKFNIKGGYGETDGLYERFYLMENNRFHVKSVDSYVDPSFVVNNDEFRRLSVNVYCGVGVGYDVISRKVGVGPQVGVGIGYRIW